MFDDYVKEYGLFFHDQVKAFDEKLEVMKREIVLENIN